MALQQGTLQLYKKLISSSVIFILVLLVEWLSYSLLASNFNFGVDEGRIFQTIFLVTVALLVSRIINLVLWSNMSDHVVDARLPQLLKNIVSGFILLVAFFFIIKFVYHMSIVGLLTATGALGLLVGLSLKDTIENFIVGLLLSFDPFFKIGDVVLLGEKWGEQVRVKEITWRNTYFQTLEGNLVFVPNKVLVNMSVVNLSKPAPVYTFSVRVNLKPSFPVEKALRLFEAALFSTPGIMEKPAPIASIAEIKINKVLYELRYSINLDLHVLREVRHALFSNILAYLNIMSVELEQEKMEPQKEQQEELKLLGSMVKKFDIFSMLSNDEIKFLVSQMTLVNVPKGTVIIRQDDDGDSMYVLSEGLLKVLIKTEQDQDTMVVAKLAPGHFFGEASVLMGDKRSATIIAITSAVIYEIKKTTMQQLFSQRPEIMQILSKNIAERHIVNLEKQKHLNEPATQSRSAHYAELLSKKMKAWFGVKN